MNQRPAREKTPLEFEITSQFNNAPESSSFVGNSASAKASAPNVGIERTGSAAEYGMIPDIQEFTLEAKAELFVDRD